MTESEAIVVRVDGDHLWLGVDNGCSGCDKVSSCGAGEGRLQRVRNTIGARAGDKVIIAVPEGAVLKAALRSYLVPLMLALGGAVAGTSFGGDPGAVVGTLLGLAVGWMSLRMTSHREPEVNMRLKGAVVQLHRNESP